jgi:8-oxo-dGTP diphosphatase
MPAAAPGRTRKLVVAALVRDGGRILVSRRRADQPMPLLWEFPGGKVEPGEDPVVALAREVREELGCHVRVGRIHEVVFHAYEAFDLVMLVYACEIVAGTPSAVQVAEIAWVEARQLPELELLPADYPLARALAAETRAPSP